MFIETQRLLIREFTPTDAPFIHTLMNTPEWIQFIGDREIKTVLDAQNYIVNTFMPSYQTLGYGFCCVVAKESTCLWV